jgi:sortase A
MVKSRMSIVSVVLIAAGCALVAVPLIWGIVTYPWFSIVNENVNAIELPEPPPPVIGYIEYTAYVPVTESVPEKITDSAEAMPVIDNEEFLVTIIPGGDEPDETEEPAEEEEVYVMPVFVLMGSVKIPRINISENLFLGTEEQTKYGLGFLDGSALPGTVGNTVIAGHRTSSTGKQPFRHLDKMQNGDLVTVRVNDVVYNYEVYDMFIVAKEDVWVLMPLLTERSVLTLVTCEPVVSAGSRPDRLIVRARLL